MFRAALRLPRVEGNLHMHPGGTKVLTCIIRKNGLHTLQEAQKRNLPRPNVDT